MISIEEARRIIAEAIPSRVPERRALAAAHGCVLAEDVVADAAYPAADRSMMDGYAIAAGEGDEFRIVGEVRTGAPPSMALSLGECARVFTGAEVPAGTERVVPQEDAVREGDSMRVVRRAAQIFIRRRGVEAQPGDVVLRRGCRLGAAELAILAQVGAVNVAVLPPVRVRHVATGDELIAPDAPLVPGRIRDTNSSLLAALVAEAGAQLTGQQRCGDDLAQLTRWTQERDAEVLLISGGASVGDYDFGARALRDAGFTIHFDKVNLRPGKPLIFATRGEQAAFVIPGNPVSHFVCFHVAIRLTIEAQSRWEFVRIELGGTQPLHGDARETFWPARVEASGGRLVAHPLRWSSSGDTFALAGVNALIRVTADGAPGATVPVLLLDAPR